MTKIVSQARIETALKRNVPSAADRDIKIGNKVLMFCKKRAPKWVSLYLVADHREKMLRLNTEERLLTALIDKVKQHASQNQERQEGQETPNQEVIATQPRANIDFDDVLEAFGCNPDFQEYSLTAEGSDTTIMTNFLVLETLHKVKH